MISFCAIHVQRHMSITAIETTVQNFFWFIGSTIIMPTPSEPSNIVLANGGHFSQKG